MRLGELLIHAGLLAADELAQALRAQVLWGARLGTNLVELHLIDLDTLSRVVARQHQLPAALAHHFEAADGDLQRQLSPELAAQYACVPLRRLTGDRVAIATVAPLDGRARALIADQLGISYKQLVPAITAELRIHYQLERVYGIARDTRFLRARERSEAPAIPVEADDSGPIAAPSPPPDAAVPDGIPEALLPEFTPRIAVDPPSAERRRYIRTIDERTGPIPLGRIELKRVASEPRPCATLDDAALAIRRAPDRASLAKHVLEAIDRFVRARAAVLLVVRGEVATSWAGWSRTGAPVPDLAVPLAEPNLVAAVRRDPALARAPAADNPIDVRLLHALGAPDGELAVAPIPIGADVRALIAIAAERGAPLEPLDAIRAAAAVALARLLRHADR